MKKLITLSIGILCIGTVFAQNRQRGYDQQDYLVNGYQNPTYSPGIVHHDHVYGDFYRIENDSRMHRFIERINYRYERKIERVEHNWSLQDWEKERIINNLEIQRHEEIREISERFHGGYEGRY